MILGRTVIYNIPERKPGSIYKNTTNDRDLTPSHSGLPSVPQFSSLYSSSSFWIKIYPFFCLDLTPKWHKVSSFFIYDFWGLVSLLQAFVLPNKRFVFDLSFDLSSSTCGSDPSVSSFPMKVIFLSIYYNFPVSLLKCAPQNSCNLW